MIQFFEVIIDLYRKKAAACWAAAFNYKVNAYGRLHAKVYLQQQQRQQPQFDGQQNQRLQRGQNLQQQQKCQRQHLEQNRIPLQFIPPPDPRSISASRLSAPSKAEKEPVLQSHIFAPPFYKRVDRLVINIVCQNLNKVTGLPT